MPQGMCGLCWDLKVSGLQPAKRGGRFQNWQKHPQRHMGKSDTMHSGRQEQSRISMPYKIIAIMTRQD